MKFLCLHGMGCNARIFEAQTSQLTWALKKHGHEFLFVDAIAPCEAPDGEQATATCIDLRSHTY